MCTAGDISEAHIHRVWFALDEVSKGNCKNYLWTHHLL